jgi:hypothetical protein
MISFFDFLTSNTLSVYTFIAFICGVSLLFLRKIEVGDHAEVTFFDSGTRGYWKEGLCLAANPFPFLRNIGINTFWDVLLPIREQQFNPNIIINHHYDQRETGYRVNVSTGLFAANMDKLINRFFGWLFGVSGEPAHLLFQRVGFRLMLITIVVTYGLNITHSKNNTRPPQASQSFFSQNIWDRGGSLTVNAQLQKGAQPFMPQPEMFIPTNGETWEYVEIKNDSRKYVKYNERLTQDGIPQIEITEKMCVLIPAGRKIGFNSRFAPEYAIEMNKMVHYMKKRESLDVAENIIAFVMLPTNKSLASKDGWNYLYNNWTTVDTPHYVFIAQAKPQYSPAIAGGLVCF